MSEETITVHHWVAKAEMDYQAALDLARRRKKSAIRYPGWSANVEDANEAVRAMKQVRKFVRAKLGLSK